MADAFPPTLLPETHRRFGVLLVGHGTSDAQGCRAFLELTQLIRVALPLMRVEVSFLERVRPTIAEGLTRLAESGATRVAVAPLMLFAARHVRHDIPRQVAGALAAHPGVEAVPLPHLGCNPHVVELSARRFDEAIPRERGLGSHDIGLVFVGRGSRDPEAQTELSRLVALRSGRTPVAWSEVCHLAMARPTLAEGLTRAARRGASLIVVQPHLLFSGLLMDQVRRAVQATAAREPRFSWRLAEPLGPHPFLATAVAQRVESAWGGERGWRHPGCGSPGEGCPSWL